MQIADLALDDPRWSTALPVLQELRPGLTDDQRRTVQQEGEPQGLRFTAAFDDDGRCVGVAGWRLMATTFAGRKLYVDDLVTSSSVRSAGVGGALLGELERRAREAGCTVLALDSGVQRHGAHRFYLRERMAIRSHHFTKWLTDESR